MSDLVAFLTARLDEDEGVARWEARRDDQSLPTRALADVEAKRAIVAFAATLLEGEDSQPWAGEEVLVRLATAYKDHPDYRPEWKP